MNWSEPEPIDFCINYFLVSRRTCVCTTIRSRPFSLYCTYYIFLNTVWATRCKNMLRLVYVQDEHKLRPSFNPNVGYIEKNTFLFSPDLIGWRSKINSQESNFLTRELWKSTNHQKMRSYLTHFCFCCSVDSAHILNPSKTANSVWIAEDCVQVSNVNRSLRSIESFRINEFMLCICSAHYRSI